MTPVINLDADRPLADHEHDLVAPGDWRRAYREAALVFGSDEAGAALWAACAIGLAIVDRDDEDATPIRWTAKEIERLVGRRGLYLAGGLDETSVRRAAGGYVNRIRGWMRWWRP